MPKVFETNSFERDTKTLSKAEQQQLESLKDQLAEHFGIGKPLQYSFLREKRIGSKRIYFLVYEEQDAVLLVAISDKKAQQETIDKIVELLPEYKKIDFT